MSTKQKKNKDLFQRLFRKSPRMEVNQTWSAWGSNIGAKFINSSLQNCGLLVAWGDREKKRRRRITVIYSDRMMAEVVAWHPLVETRLLT